MSWCGEAGLRRDCTMSTESPLPDGEKKWESVHLCPKCGHSLNLEEIELEAVTTGIATCPKCDWSSPINLKIVQDNKPQ
jgi:ribosomal protein L37AE/L43A